MYEKNKSLKDMNVVDTIKQLEAMLDDDLGTWLEIRIEEEGNGECIDMQQVADAVEEDDAIDFAELLRYFRSKRFRSKYEEANGNIYRRCPRAV